MGFDVDLHPEGAIEGGRPDFRAHLETEAFYLEATVVVEADSEHGAQRRLQDLYDTINRRLASPNFMLSVKQFAIGLMAAPGREIVGWLGGWLDGLDPDEVIRTIQDRQGGLALDHAPRVRWTRDGWDIEFQAIPNKPEARSRPGFDAMGAFGPGQASYIDTVSPIRDRLEKKGTKYGHLDAPLIIAVLREDTFASDEVSVADALYGTEAVRFDTKTFAATRIRNPDGLWTRAAAPRFTNISAVVMALNLAPWSVTRIAPRLWLNPWAEHALAAKLPWGRVEVSLLTGQLEAHDGTEPPHEILGLPAEWPSGDPFGEPFDRYDPR